jgi:putative spermidine/putrescine transport system ATP-binding protein
MACLELRNLSKRYADHVAVKNVTLDVSDGEFLVLLGPSGCGKTTTLRMIAGFVEPTGGEARIGGVDVTYLPPWRRNTGMVFQSYALFPHLTVIENVSFGLQVRKLSKPEIAVRSAEVLKLVRLEGLSGRFPRELSGGEQQRVALARALAIRPDVLLLDEPLSNLDARLREEVRIEIRELQRHLRLTTVMVTHDQEEALAVADRLVVMSDGEIRQIGSQRELYERPTDRFVASFVGRSTFLEGRVAAPGEFETASGLKIMSDTRGVSGPASLALRPERLILTPTEPLDNCLAGRVEFLSFLGAMLEVHVRLSPADRVVAYLPNRGNALRIDVGDTVEVGWPCEAGLVFAGQGSPVVQREQQDDRQCLEPHPP